MTQPKPTPTPTVGRIVHYVSRGSADGVYRPECRAAIVTGVDTRRDFVGNVDLCVLNPEGMFFNRGVHYDAGDETPGNPRCPEPHVNGPFRYCACGWVEAGYRGGTWHWPERA